MDEESGGSGEELVGSGSGDDGPLAKVGNALFMMCLGVVLFPCSLYLLGWNENNYVCENNRILYGEANAKEVNCNAGEVLNQFSFFSCPFVQSTLQTFTPCTFNRQNAESCQGQPAVQFTSASGRQVVEMYQCKESCRREKRKGPTGRNMDVKTCTYEMAWSESSINSAEFTKSASSIGQSCPNLAVAGGNPTPPQNLDIGTTESYATGVIVGNSTTTGFTLNQDLITQLYPSTAVSLTPFSSPQGQAPVAGQPWSRPLSISANNVVVSPDGKYLSTCPSNEALGCVRISYYRSNSTSPTVMTRVESAGQTVKETVPGSWGCSSKPWQAILPAKLGKSEFVEELQANNTVMVWLLRIIGLVACWLSVYCCFQPISAAADIAGDCINFLPCGGYIEDFLEGMVESVLCFMSCGIGCASGFTVIALVWLFMRPLIGGGLLVVALVFCGCVAAVRSQSTRRTVKGSRPGARPNAPVDRDTAQRFIDALRSEYLMGRQQAVADFFDEGVSPEDQEALVPFEDRVRDSQDRASVIELLEVKWGLS